MNQQPCLTIEIRNKLPVSLIDLSRSFQGLADEHKRYVQQVPTPTAGADVSLHVREIRKGSITTDLVALSPIALPYIEHTLTVLDFTAYLKTAYDWLLGKTTEKPDLPLEKGNFENFAKIIEPIAKDKDASMGFNGQFQFNAPVTFQMTSLEANAAQNAAQREIDKLQDRLRHRETIT